MPFYNYNQHLRERANYLRKHMTKSEACAWKYLFGGRKMGGYQFRRQRPMGNFIVDFVCFELKLVIEIDGITHDNPIQQAKDEVRDRVLNSMGFTVLRFSAYDVLRKKESVRNCVLQWIAERENGCG